MPPDAVPSDEPNDEEKLEQMPEDTEETPFRPADDATYQDDQAQGGLTPLQPDEDTTAGPDAVIDGDVQSDETVVQPDVGDIHDTHPQTDTNLEPEEYYDEGISGAAEVGEPNAENDVIGYNPPPGRKRQK